VSKCNFSCLNRYFLLGYQVLELEKSLSLHIPKSGHTRRITLDALLFLLNFWTWVRQGEHSADSSSFSSGRQLQCSTQLA
jgi:hypothetical protein